MRKFFTLAAAAVMAFTASAGTAVRTQMPALCSAFSETQKQMRQEVVATHEFLSRGGEDESIPLEGKYFYAVYYVIPDDSGKSAIGESIETVGYYEIVKDADVENGYLIKNFMSEYFNAGRDEELEFSDLKATFDPTTNTLTIPGGQFLFHATEKNDKTGEVEELNNHLIAGIDGQLWSYDDPLQFRWNQGRMYMTSDAYVIGELYEKDGKTYMSAYANLFFQVNSYIPNGTLDCFMSGLNTDKSFPILGVWQDSAFFVVNFTGCDPLHYAALLYNPATSTVKGSNRFNPQGYAGWALAKIPASFTVSGNAIDIDYKLNPAFMDETGMPIGTGWEIEGTVVEASADKVIVEFPTYGLFDLNDILYAEIQDAVLTFQPNAIAGIETIEAADNTNAPVVYYNLQGQRVNNPANGIFIRQQGTNATKVLVK